MSKERDTRNKRVSKEEGGGERVTETESEAISERETCNTSNQGRVRERKRE